MHFRSHILCIVLGLWRSCVSGLPTLQLPLVEHWASDPNRNISVELFSELEELSRLVDISYCVGTTGIQKPFLCASRCQDFEGFELVTTWSTGILLADSCGYIAISHPPSPPRIIVAFRGTYSVANAIVDLSTIPQEYAPYPGDDEDGPSGSAMDFLSEPLGSARRPVPTRESKCDNCTVHAGFMTSWRHTRSEILPYLEQAIKQYPSYQLTLVGHSLGGAVAALGSLDFKVRGWNPKVTTFGEPRIGNQALMHYIDKAFVEDDTTTFNSMYRRVTHIDDPVPLLPVKEWGYRMHAGEIYITKPELSPSVTDLQYCIGDEDPLCIGGADPADIAPGTTNVGRRIDLANLSKLLKDNTQSLAIPARYRLWQLFFAHRDYFWRLGLCIPGGDPKDWYREYPHLDPNSEGQEL